jgi:hypothetical protein
MPSKTCLKGTGGLPLVPGLFSSPSIGAIFSQRSVGIRRIVPNLSMFFTRPQDDETREAMTNRIEEYWSSSHFWDRLLISPRPSSFFTWYWATKIEPSPRSI